MTVIRATEQALTAENKPAWCQIQRAGFFQLAKEGGVHDRHHHDYNELYFICGGKAKISIDGQEHYVKPGDIVCIEAGAEHDILEVYATTTSSCSGCTSRVRLADASGTYTAVPKPPESIQSRPSQSRLISRTDEAGQPVSLRARLGATRGGSSGCFG